MTERRLYIGVNLAVHLLPAATKCIVFRKVPAGHRVDHTVKDGTVRIEVFVLMVVDTIEFGIPFEHACKHITFNTQKPGRTIEHFGKPVDDLGILVFKIHDERAREFVQVAGITGLNSLFGLVPHDNLLRVDGTRNVVAGGDQTQDRFSLKMNIRVDKQKVVRLGLLHESRDGQVTGPVNERLVLGRVEHELDAVLGAQPLQTQYRFGIRLEAHATVARRTQKQRRH